ncbi:glycoside hydrolase family 99-like domain-containing protein [Vibrio sp. PID23_8]|uniref:glycoside hydrolase family 99-like domain-containing protein n=1 Tax=Vibrio sp. PID23_8 TaxID=1583767 RepID=UPI000E6859E9|nr:glycoside hydrolase family 99-like domain-containing protein [Vibrio sp. PID23_8]
MAHFNIQKKFKKLTSEEQVKTNAELSNEEKSIETIYHSGLFSTEWYFESNPDIAEAQVNPLEHYFFNGEKEGRTPSYLFDPTWYLDCNPDVKSSGMAPLEHYILYGEKEGRKPSIYFDPEFYRIKYNLDEATSPLKHFYDNVQTGQFDPVPEFNSEYYLTINIDIKDAGLDAFKHFILQGYLEGRNPNPEFNVGWYAQEYLENDLSKHAFYHFLSEGKSQGLKTSPQTFASNGQENTSIPSNTSVAINYIDYEAQYHKAGAQFEEFAFGARTHDPDVKLIAYYLPQFHPFTENNEWWGTGFTEWTNVTRARPRFNGHVQPHLPRDLGFYDLRLKETLVKQAEMARAAGLEGFCFYHYWFNGKRLMDGPVNLLLENGDIELPFCLMWTNENWSRRWDGLDQDILIAQDYRDEDDEAFIADIVRHFEDPRYIRIDGKPLFFIYRPGIVPEAKAKFEKWRELLKTNHDTEVIFYMAQAFDDNDPRPYGLDGAIEFPPHKVAAGLPSVAQELGLFDPNFTGHYPSYDAMAENSLSDVEFEYDVIKAVTPMWDNEARKPNRGMGFVGATPQKYQRWLSSVIDYARRNPVQGGHKFVAINAWNEWAEGAYLEPDQYYGSAYLNATYRAAYGIETLEGKYPVVLVGHDAYKHGAQLLTLNIFKTLRQQFGVDARLIILGEGPLVEEYEKIGPTYVCHNDLEKFREYSAQLQQEIGVKRAICNTTVSGKTATILHEQGYEFVSLVHELENLIREYSLEGAVNDISAYAKQVIFAAKAVKDSFVKVAESADDSKLIIHPQGIYQAVSYQEEAYLSIREELGIPDSAKLVVNVGYADLRKGFDIFVNTAKVLVERDPSFHFLWIGDIEGSLKHWLKSDLESELLKGNFHNIPFTNEISRYLSASDVFAMTSREDPFPSVVMEALAIGTPVVGFIGGGGFTELLEEPVNGAAVPMADIQSMANEITAQVVEDNEEKRSLRRKAAAERFSWDDYVFSLLQYLDPNLEKVTVSIPNYNYEKHIGERLRSVFAQHYPVFEVVVLDDRSPDNSIEVINATAEAYQRQIKLIVNEENSGSVFKQWKKGADLARGDYLWIAEADDSAAPEFLSTILSGDTEFDLAYTDSKQIDENNVHLADNYRYYYDADMQACLDKPGVYEGSDIIESCLAIKNQFMNVSSVVFNRQALVSCFDENIHELLEFKVAGDWFVYVKLLSKKTARCKLIPDSLNTHRRHSRSVTHQNLKIQINEIENIQVIANQRIVTKSIIEQQHTYLNNLKNKLKIG